MGTKIIDSENDGDSNITKVVTDSPKLIANKSQLSHPKNVTNTENGTTQNITTSDVPNDFNAIPFENNNNRKKQRATWNNDWEFIMSCIALAIGMGNVWRFPIVALENGGGAFLIPYLIVLLLIGKPIYYLELLIGQFSSRGCIKIYDMVPIMRGIGYGQTFAVLMTATYYASLVAITIRYFLDSFDEILPWSFCREHYVGDCIDAGNYRNILNPNDTEIIISNTSKSSSEFYFYVEILNEVKEMRANEIGPPEWRLVLCLAFSWICVVMVLIKGIKSSGKASYFLALFPYVIMIILLSRAVTLNGSADGILYFITPQWDQLLNPKVWFAAVTQVFYSLAIFLGEIIIYASHNRFRQNIYRVAVTITIVDTITSLTSGIIVFGILGNLAYEIGTPNISTVVREDAGLAFVSYPDAIAKFDFVPQIFSAAFFIMLFIIGIGCIVGLQICLMTSVQDQFKIKKQFKLIVSIVSVEFLIGLLYITPEGQYFLKLVDYNCVIFLVYILAIAELIAISWCYGIKRISLDIEFMLGIKTNLYWRISWGLIAPILLIFIFINELIIIVPITYNDHVFPDGIYALGWCLTALGAFQIPIWAIYSVFSQKTEVPLWQKFVKSFLPKPDWGPADSQLNIEYQKFIFDNMTPSKNGFFWKIYDNIFG